MNRDDIARLHQFGRVLDGAPRRSFRSAVRVVAGRGHMIFFSLKRRGQSRHGQELKDRAFHKQNECIFPYQFATPFMGGEDFLVGRRFRIAPCGAIYFVSGW